MRKVVRRNEIVPVVFRCKSTLIYCMLKKRGKGGENIDTWRNYEIKKTIIVKDLAGNFEGVLSCKSFGFKIISLISFHHERKKISAVQQR